MTRPHLSSPALAEQASEAIRTLCHRTIGDTLTTADSYAVLGELASLAHRLDQLLSQLGRGLGRRLAEPGYRLDPDGENRWVDAPTAVAATIEGLQAAAALAWQLGDLVDIAHSVAGHLIDGPPAPRSPRDPEQQEQQP